jgi:hypothetical protein
LGIGQAQASTVACFQAADVKEAQLRRMQQEFTVAALSCGVVKAQRDAIADRYNRFVDRFSDVLRANAQILQVHFAQHGGTNSFDSWMTKLANAASEDVATNPDYCRNAWLNLDAALLITPDNIAAFAANGHVPDDLVPLCGLHRPRAKTVTSAHAQASNKD